MCDKHNLQSQFTPAEEGFATPARNLEEGETRLKDNEQRLLDQICESYYLPAWCSLDDYRRIFEAQGLQVWRYYTREVVRAPSVVWTHHWQQKLGPQPPRPRDFAMSTLGVLALLVPLFQAGSAGAYTKWSACASSGHQDRGLVRGGGAVLGGCHVVCAQLGGPERPLQCRLEDHQGASWNHPKARLDATCSVLDMHRILNPRFLSSMRAAACTPVHQYEWFLTALSGPAVAQGAVVMPLMKRGFSIGLIKFNLITARKP